MVEQLVARERLRASVENPLVDVAQSERDVDRLDADRTVEVGQRLDAPPVPIPP
jgi:hypothetical protein